MEMNQRSDNVIILKRMTNTMQHLSLICLTYFNMHLKLSNYINYQNESTCTDYSMSTLAGFGKLTDKSIIMYLCAF